MDITSPAVIEIIPAPVKSSVGETPKMFRIPKAMTNIAIASITYSIIVEAWFPILGVISGLRRRKISIAVNQKTKIIVILKAWAVNIGRFTGLAINKSKI